MKISKTFIILTFIATALVVGAYSLITNVYKRPAVVTEEPSGGNLSYMVINSDENLYPTLKSPSGVQTGTKDGKTLITDIPLSSFTKESTLYNSENPGDEEGVPFWNLELKYPETGEYTLEFNAPKAGDYIFELYTYDQKGNTQVEKQNVTLKAKTPTTYIIKYSQTGEYPTTLLH